VADPTPRAIQASHALVWAAVAVALFQHLVVAALAGMLVHALIARVASILENHLPAPRYARPLALALVFFGSITGLALLGRWVLHFSSDINLVQVPQAMADSIAHLRLNLPASVLEHLPTSPETIKESLVTALKSNSEALSRTGFEGLAGALHLLWGMVIGAVVSQAGFATPQHYRPLAAALLERLTQLSAAFGKVVFAQARISLVNTLLTSIYLLLILPLAGVHLPLAKTLVLLTFVVGLLPILGNLISNTVIVVLSLGVSPEIAVSSLIYLMLIHKLEYLLNARIIGQIVKASVWEMLLAMFALESLFGLPGLVAAPVLYAYLKQELLDAGLVGVAGDK
jgi:predicted PurR-regulated permease PerM